MELETEDGTSNADNTETAERVQCSISEAVSNGMENDVEGEVQLLKTEPVNNGVVSIAVINGVGNDVYGEAQLLKIEAINNGVACKAVINGLENDAYSEAQLLKIKAVNNGVASKAVSNGVENNDVDDKAQLLQTEAVNNGVANKAVSNGVENNNVDDKAQLLQHEAANNGVAIVDGFDSAEGDSGGVECFRTYKRRKHVKSSSESKILEDCRECLEAASHLADQETFKIDKDGQECSSQFEWLSHTIQSESNGHANVVQNGCSSESNGHGVTEIFQHVLCNIVASENFSSLRKVLLENFQGMKTESVFDFSIINSRLKERAYEDSPSLFLSDIQQVWRKLQETGNEIVALAKILSDMSRTFYYEQVKVPEHGRFEDEKQVCYNRQSDLHMKPAQTEECATYKICTCMCCGDKADGTDSLVCDSCEEMYHVSCIEPAVKEIPHKSWYCANCTAKGIGSLHENCVVCQRLNDPKTLNKVAGDESFPICQRLNDPKTLNKVAGDESFPTNEETLNELEENSNCTYDGIQVSKGGADSPDCKICGNAVDGKKIKICGHPFCPSKYYHVRCLTSKELKSYGCCWYCPSCLCRVCLTDRDDDKIVLCDGCDHAYHIYCMKPPQTSIPRGKWFCQKCNAGIQAIRRAKKAYESIKGRTGENVSYPSDNLEKKWSNKRGRELEKGGGMDMLLTAANTLNFEENLAAMQTATQRT